MRLAAVSVRVGEAVEPVAREAVPRHVHDRPPDLLSRQEVADAIRKGGELARAQMVSVCLKNATLPHEVFSHFCGAKVLLRPASPGAIKPDQIQDVIGTKALHDFKYGQELRWTDLGA